MLVTLLLTLQVEKLGPKKNIVKLDYINIYVIDGKFMFFAAVCWLGIKYKDGT